MLKPIAAAPLLLASLSSAIARDFTRARFSTSR